MYLPSSVETLVSFCMTGLCALVLEISCFVNIVDRTFACQPSHSAESWLFTHKPDHRDVTRDMWSLTCIRKYLSRESTEMLVHAFMTSRVDYCNSLLYGLPNCQLHKLQRVLNASARLVCNVPRFCHISPLLRSLHWLPVKARIQNRYCLLRSKQFTALFLDIYASYYTCQVSRLRRDCHACRSKTWISSLCSDLPRLVETFEPLQH